MNHLCGNHLRLTRNKMPFVLFFIDADNRSVGSIVHKKLNEHADAHPTPGDDTGDLKTPATLCTHETVPGLQAAFWTFALGAPVHRLGFVFGRLTLNSVRVLFFPIVTLTLSHDACIFFNDR